MSPLRERILFAVLVLIVIVVGVVYLVVARRGGGGGGAGVPDSFDSLSEVPGTIEVPSTNPYEDVPSVNPVEQANPFRKLNTNPFSG